MRSNLDYRRSQILAQIDALELRIHKMSLSRSVEVKKGQNLKESNK